MASENGLEKRFSDNIDRLLAGLPIEADRAMDEDMAFAQKIVSLRCVPSPEFKERLKTRLITRMNAERARKPSWLGRVWPRRLGWQIAVAFAVLLIAIGYTWGRGLFQTSVQGPPPGALLSVTASTDRQVYKPGEQVTVQVTLKNVTDKPLDIAQFPPILSLMESATKQPVYTLTGGETPRTVQPDQTVTFTESWNQRDDKGRMVPSGAYYLELEDIDYQGQAIKLNLAHVVQFKISSKA